MNNERSSPIIIDLGDSEYVSLYKMEIDDESGEIEVDYRYTGNKSKETIDSLLNEKINELLREYLEKISDGR